VKNGKLYFIRHSITEAVEKRWMYGLTDLPLTEGGFDLIRELKKEGIYPSCEDKDVYSSGLLRADQTLTTIYGDIPFVVERNFREMGVGKFECKHYTELADDEDFKLWANDTTGSVVCPGEGGECLNDFCARVKHGFYELISKQQRDAIIVCHGGAMASLLFDRFGGASVYDWIPKPGRGYVFIIEDGELKSAEPF